VDMCLHGGIQRVVVCAVWYLFY